MARAKRKQVHVYLDDDLFLKISEYSEKKGVSMSGVVVGCVGAFFEEGVKNALKRDALKWALEKRFNIPKGFNASSFFLTLYILAKNHPETLVRDEWGEFVYLDADAISNKEVLSKITKDISLKLNKDNV